MPVRGSSGLHPKSRRDEIPLRAAAFHETISRKRLDELFRSDANQLFGGNTAGHCPQCGAQFAVFFPASDDPKNLEYLDTIQREISKDCKAGKHAMEILLNTTP